MRPLNKFVSAEESMLEFTGVGFNGDNIIIDGKVLYLHNIRSCVNSLISEIKDHIKNELLFGIDIIDIDWSPDIIHEEPRNARVSYSAFDDPHNPFCASKDTVLRIILTDPRLRGRFHYVDERDHIIWKAGPCFAYMEIAHEVEMKLFSSTQMTVGEPGRGTEVASHLIRNAAGGSLRNVFIMFQFFVTMGTFNKTSHISDRDITMIRVPLPEIGRLWILYLTYIRPVLVAWQLYFNGPRAASRTKHCLFAGPYRAVTSSDLSRHLSMHTFKHLQIKIPISLWRHIVTWFLNHNCSRFQEYLTLAGKSILAYQSGHGPKSHSLYAGDSRIPGGIDFHSFFQTMLASGVWHELLGFPPVLLDSMTQTRTRVTGSSVITDTAFDKGDVRTSILADAKLIATEVAKAIIPDFHRMHAQTRANDLASFLHVLGLDLRTCSSLPFEKTPTHVAHPSRILALRQFLRDDKATFKHPQQALAVELMASGYSSVLLIAPTGTLSACGG